MNRSLGLALLTLAFVLGALATAGDGASVASDRMKTIGFGKPVDLTPHITKGKVTIVDFYSDYCGPCVLIGALLEQALAKEDTVRLVRVNVNRPGVKGIDFRSPLARQYRLTRLPSFLIYTDEGKLVKQDDDAYDAVISWLEHHGLWPPKER